MRLLFDMDKKDYNINGTTLVRPSSRGIYIKNGKIALVHSIKFDYYKFPGGGVEKHEDKVSALIREFKEESGLSVIPDSVKEYGYVHRIQKGETEDVFIQDNYYYLVDCYDGVGSQKLDDYENDEGFTLEFVDPALAISVNMSDTHDNKSRAMLEREARVLKMLIDENYFD